jgi:hypothetical protein
MNRVLKLITNFFYKNSPKPLGRWNIEYCSKKIDNKIDLSNEDHCGPCGQYRITKIHKPIIKKNTNIPPSYMPPFKS